MNTTNEAIPGAVGAPVEASVSRQHPERAALADVVKAWESLEGGHYYGPRAVEAWLAGPMMKAVNQARQVLGGRHLQEPK
jgi:hypothetical protein